jgi:hypothetical protein
MLRSLLSNLSYSAIFQEFFYRLKKARAVRVVASATKVGGRFKQSATVSNIWGKKAGSLRLSFGLGRSVRGNK